MVTITLRMEETENNRLEVEAKRRGMNKSELVRDLVHSGLKRKKSSKPLSAYDVMKHACGMIKGGPADFSTNKKYMKGYGA